MLLPPNNMILLLLDPHALIRLRTAHHNLLRNHDAIIVVEVYVRFTSDCGLPALIHGSVLQLLVAVHAVKALVGLATPL